MQKVFQQFEAEERRRLWQQCNQFRSRLPLTFSDSANGKHALKATISGNPQVMIKRS